MYMKKIIILSLAIISISTLCACNKNNEEVSSIENSTTSSKLEAGELEDGKLEEMNMLEFIRKISKINKVDDGSGVYAKEVFGKYPMNMASGRYIPVYYNDDIYINMGESDFENSAYITLSENVEYDNTESVGLTLALYDYDEIKLLKEVENSLDNPNLELVKEIQKQDSDGVIESLIDIKESIIKLSKVKQNSTVEELTDIFGKAPKDISDGYRDKFVYYAGELTIVLYDSPFSHMELFVPGGSVKVMFEDNARIVE